MNILDRAVVLWAVRLNRYVLSKEERKKERKTVSLWNMHVVSLVLPKEPRSFFSSASYVNV